jgi:PAS domain S-box-containing protein
MNTPPTKPVSMSQRLTLALVLTMTLVVALVGSGFHLYTADKLEKTFTRKVEQTLSYLDGTLSPVLWNYDHNTAARVARTALQDDLVEGITIRDENGKDIFSDVRQGSEDMLVRTRTFRFQNRTLGELELYFSRASLNETLNDILLASLSVWLLSVLSIVVFTNLFIRKYFRRPLASFIDLAKSYSKHHKDPPLSTTPFIEFQPIEEVVKNLANDVFTQLRVLRDSEANYRTIFENALYGIAITGPDFKFVKVNDAWCKLIGYTEDELIDNMGIGDVTFPDDLPKSMEVVEKLIHLKIKDYNLEKRYKTKSGKIIEALTFIKGIYDEDDRYLGNAASILDITERKLAEVALKESEAKYRRIFESVEDGYILSDMDGTILSVNPATVRMLEYDTSAQLIGLNVENDVYTDVRQRENLKAALIKKGMINGYQLDFRKGDGEVISADCNIHLIYNKTNEPIAIEGTFRDITARKRSEEELERYRNRLEVLVEERTSELEVSEEKYRTLYNKSPGMMISVDVSTRKVVECNETLLEATGFSREEIIGREVFALYHPNSVETARKVFEQFLATDEIHNADLQLIKKNGEKIDVLLDVTARVDKKTGKKYTLSVWRDITERKHLEQHILHAKEEAERANQAKSQFLANMSHEIRTPMNAVLGFAEILRGKELDSKKRHYIESIHSSGKALLSLINDILDLSKIEAGKMELQYSSLSIHGLFQEMKTIFDQKITDKGVKFIVESSEELPEALILDETRIRQILINLLGNAAKFTDNGHIRLAVFSRSTKDESRSMVDLVMEVEDTGMGIPLEQQGKIFDAFEQAVGRKKSQSGGTGLGLAITRNLVAMMNGEISVSSEPGKGSTFRVTIHDVEISASAALEEKLEKAFDFSTMVFKPATILIVDDIDYNREMLATYMDRWDFNIIFAKNGREAIEQVRKHHLDLILLDMKMPEMDGYEASEILRKENELKDIPVIAITASALKQDEEVISKLCNGYLRKPVSRTDLVREIMKHLPHTVKEINEEIPSKEIPPAEMVFPPPDQIKKLLKAAKMGSVTDLKADISEIRNRNLKYQTFTDQVEALSQKYEFDKIIKLLEQQM